MNSDERAVILSCQREQLLGIVTPPSTDQSLRRTGVVIIVGGPQYRAGSHRQFVLLARALAQAGYPVLRFDYRGMGDSTGAQREFHDVSADVAAAVDGLQQTLPGVRNVVLWGLCDGASAGLLYCHATNDARVTGLCLLNPWVRSEESLARAHVKHYYADRLRQTEFWLKLLSGKVAGAAFASLWRNVALASGHAGATKVAHTQAFQIRMASAWQRFGGKILLLLSGNDYTAKEFLQYVAHDAAWVGLLDLPFVTRHDLAEADHTFSNAMHRERVETITLDWLRNCIGQ